MEKGIHLPEGERSLRFSGARTKTNFEMNAVQAR